MAEVDQMVRKERRRRKRRVRSSRKLRFFLMSLGLTGLLLGMGLFGFGLSNTNPMIVKLGIVYVACSGAVLLVRTAIDRYDDARRKRYVRKA